jgi:hypothetical protein
MKLRNFIVLVLIIGGCVGVWWFGPWRERRPVESVGGTVVLPPVRPPETPSEREERWVREAKTALAAAITNGVPVHKRTIRVEENIGVGRSVSDWSANAVVEFTDRNGNFGRTTLFWRFETNAAQIRLIPISY